MLNLIVLFGGASSEHDISILSAKNVVSFIDAELYQLFIVYITKDGLWKYIPQKDAALAASFSDCQKSP